MKYKIFHISFWITIALGASILMLIYLISENKSIVPAFIPLMSAIITITLAEKVRGDSRYYPRNIIEYLFTNTLFFLLFLFVLFTLSGYLVIKIGAFLIMTFVGIYTSYFLIKHQKQSKSGLK